MWFKRRLTIAEKNIFVPFLAAKHFVKMYLPKYEYGIQLGMLQNLKNEVMRFGDRGNNWIENSEGHKDSFVGFIPILSNETLRSLKRNAYLPYPVWAILLKEPASLKQ